MAKRHAELCSQQILEADTNLKLSQHELSETNRKYVQLQREFSQLRMRVEEEAELLEADLGDSLAAANKMQASSNGFEVASVAGSSRNVVTRLKLQMQELEVNNKR